MQSDINPTKVEILVVFVTAEAFDQTLLEMLPAEVSQSGMYQEQEPST